MQNCLKTPTGHKNSGKSFFFFGKFINFAVRLPENGTPAAQSQNYNNH